MGVGLYLQGHSDVPDWIDQLRDRLAELQHPAAEDIEVDDDGIVSAATTPVGPGYHVALCDALHDASRTLAITWDPPDPDGDGDTGDETGYFFAPDLAAVEREMLQWLKTLATVVLEQDAVDGIALAMPRTHTYQTSGIHTPTGPRDLAWLRAVGGDPRRGLDFFPWWAPGDNAAALLGRARCLMATQVRWREPSFEEEDDLHADVEELLRRAWDLDPSLDYPAREWCELAPDAPAEIQARARTATGPLLGYRRHPVRVALADGWSVEIPGDFSEEWEDGTWSAWHQGRTVWFDCYRRDAPAAELADAAPEAGELLTRQDGPVLKKAYLAAAEDGFTLSTRNAVDGKLAISTIVFPDDSHRDWAMRAWASFRNE